MHTTSRKLFSLSTQLAGKCVIFEQIESLGGFQNLDRRMEAADLHKTERCVLHKPGFFWKKQKSGNMNIIMQMPMPDPLYEKMQTCIDRSGKKALGDVMQLLTGCWLLWAVHNNQSWVAWAHLDLVFSMLQLHIIGALFNRRPVCARHAAPKLPNCDCSLSQSYLTCWSCVRG